MDQKIRECLREEQDSYLLPFLWLHGESKERLKEEILAIRNSGIREFCAESRPYENFCREQWWDDFGFILQTARELGMRVWLLDDRKFPTGYANGYLEAPERAHLRKKVIREFQSEAIGPMKKAKFYVGEWGKKESGRVLQVLAYRHADDGERLDPDSAVDLTDTLYDDMVTWDVPEGTWRICVTVESHTLFSKDNRLHYYVDMLNADSCRAMIDAIYQPHYEHFAEYFGNTFAGFFSDEPGFLNLRGSYYNTLGKMFTPYPWSEELPRLIAESSGMEEETVRRYIPALWEDLGEITATVRMHYMEVITKLYRKNFGYLLGDWCRAHGVLYIGHVIEDKGAHMRMGYGAGNFFRALDGQDMARIDVVLLQDIPGFSGSIHRASLADGGAADPKFFRYTMPKLASSHAHIQPLKKGRAMCEIFGAFGWAEGLPYMKGLADIMLVSGINYFVPHAFSPKEDDPDCPPHFYNGGKNVQYPLFKNLMGYMGRCAHMLKDGIHRADVAVFYNAEGEWTGGRSSEINGICHALATNLIDFDIIPYDYLANASVKDQRLYVNGESYGALIVSECEILPIDRLKCFAELAKQGLPIVFEQSLPERAAEGGEIADLLPLFETVPLKELPDVLRGRGLCHVEGEGDRLSSLRFYHVGRDGKEIYLFSNEAIRDDVSVQLRLREQGEYLIYEPWSNRCYRGETENGRVRLQIEKGNMLFLVFGDEIPEGLEPVRRMSEQKPLPLRFTVSVKEEEDGEFRVVATDSELFDVSDRELYPHFSGEILYETLFDGETEYCLLDLGEVGEVAEAWLNGTYLGARINAPYRFDMSPALREGSNALRILVKSNLAHRRRDRLSGYIQIPPSGIMGDITVAKYESM